jgi:hypothetical protein
MKEIGPMRTEARKQVTRAVTSLRAIAIGVIVLGTTSACKNLLEVELPTKVSADALDNPALAQTLVTSAIGEFECAFSNYVPATGEATDELRHSSGWLVFTLWDERRINADNSNQLCNVSTGHGIFVPMQKARYAAESAKERIKGWADADVPGRATHLAALAAYGAYARTFLGEVFCEMAFDEGPILTPAAALATAEAGFTDAITLARAAGSKEYEHMALVGRARVRIFLGNKAGAKADALLVPKGFRKNATYSGADPYRYNYTYQANYVDGNISVSDEFRDLKFAGVPDPRVRVVDSPSKGHNQSTIYRQTKYTGHSPITIASWEEAQLIIAEADLGPSAVNIINDLHTAAGLPPYVPANVANDAEILAQVIQERSRQLFLEGHRMADFIHFKIPFATGTSPYTGVTYGTTTCFPMVRAEQSSNPNYPK